MVIYSIYNRIVSKILMFKPKRLRSREEEISRLYREGSVISKSLANSLNATLKKNISPEERAWIDKIESLRAELNASNREITIVDYGAGSHYESPNLNLDTEEMEQGRVTTKTVREVCRTVFKKPFLLFKLIREFEPSVCLELGTGLGVSTAYQLAALELDRNGRIVTIEGAESLASLAGENFRKLGLEKRVALVVGRFQDALKDVLRKNSPVDFVFIDGHHDERATLAYFEEILPFLSKSAVLVFDNINWSAGMERAWKTIASDKRVKISVDLLRVGICVIAEFLKTKQSFKFALD